MWLTAMIAFLFFVVLIVWYSRKTAKTNGTRQDPLTSAPVAQLQPPKPLEQGQPEPVSREPIGLIVTVTHQGSTPAPPQQPATEQDRDAWDQSALDLYMSGERRAMAGIHLRLNFEDVGGALTTRDVDSIAFTYDEDQHSGVLWAFCHLRNATRPFRYSGIRRSVDLDTGELIQDLGAYLQQKYERTPAGAVDRFLKEHRDAVYCLFCIAKADGALRQKERTAISLLIQELGLRDQEPLELLIEQIRTQWDPSQTKPYWDAVKAVAARPDASTLAPDLLARMQQVIATDKTAHPDELKLLRYAAKTWKLTMPG